MISHGSDVVSAPDQQFWWIAIGMVIVVVLCVIVLLSLLSSFVADIGDNVDSVTNEVVGLAHNTSASPLLADAARLIGDLGVEVERNVRAVSEVGEKR
jgi:uncharacterized protein YoxC